MQQRNRRTSRGGVRTLPRLVREIRAAATARPIRPRGAVQPRPLTRTASGHPVDRHPRRPLPRRPTRKPLGPLGSSRFEQNATDCRNILTLFYFCNLLQIACAAPPWRARPRTRPPLLSPPSFLRTSRPRMPVPARGPYCPAERGREVPRQFSLTESYFKTADSVNENAPPPARPIRPRGAVQPRPRVLDGIGDIPSISPLTTSSATGRSLRHIEMFLILNDGRTRL